MTDELPRGWLEVPLSEIAALNMGQSPPSTSYNKSGDGLPFFQGKAEFGDLHPTAQKFCSEPNKIAEPDDILISVRAPVGPTNLCRERSCIGRGLAAIRPYDGIPSRYLLFYFRSIEAWLATQGTGSTFTQIGKSDLQEIEVPLAPLNEQQRIVAKLERLLAKVDASQRRLAKIPALLKRFRQCVLAAACSGRLTADWREKNAVLCEETALSETTNSEDALPTAWKMGSLKEVAEKVQDGNYGALYPKPDEWISGGVAFLIPAAIAPNGKVDLDKVRFISPKRNAQLKKAQLAEGDVIFPNRGSRDAQRYGLEPFAISIPKTLFPANINPQLTLVRPRVDVLASSYLRLALNAEFFLGQIREATGGSALAFINLTKTKTLQIPLPPLAEQKEIARRLEELFALADQIEARYAKAKAHVEKLTQSILAKAFRGKLVPQDPNDEPASVLLERIRSQTWQQSKSNQKRKRPSVATVG